MSGILLIVGLVVVGLGGAGLLGVIVRNGLAYRRRPIQSLTRVPSWSYAGPPFQRPIDTIGLQIRVLNLPMAHEILTVGDLLAKSDEELLSYHLLGRFVLKHINERLLAEGYGPERHASPFSGN